MTITTTDLRSATSDRLHQNVQAKPHSTLPLLFATAVASLGGFLFGYDTAVVNGANQFLTQYFGLDAAQEGLAGASAIIGCIPGAMMAGFLSDRFGRRRMLFFCAFIYALSGILSAVPTTFPAFLAARFLSGLGIGASSMICPVYIAELAPEKWRGRLGALFQFGIVTGIFVTLFINLQIQNQGDTAWNTAVGWRWMLGAEAVPAAALFFLLFTVPESPRWFAQKSRFAEAHTVLTKMLGPQQANTALADLKATRSADQGHFRDLFTAAYRRPMLIAVLLMLFSQLSGINAIMYYSTKIFTTAGAGQSDAFSSSVWIGLVNIVFTMVAIALVDRAGRRPLLLIGTALQTLSLAAVGYLFYTGQSGSLLLGGIIVFIGAFAVAMGAIPWILCSEIFPTHIRGRAMSVATFVIWTACYAVAQTFPMLNDNPRIGPAWTFGIYGVFSLLSFVFVLLMVPETKGKSLELISAELRRVSP